MHAGYAFCLTQTQMPLAAATAPHLPTDPSMKDVRLTFRCTKAQAAQARERAKADGVQLSAALRSLLDDYIHRRRTTPAHVRQAKVLARELHAIGVNINQIAHALNAGAEPAPIRPKLLSLAKTLRRLHRHFTALSVA